MSEYFSETEIKELKQLRDNLFLFPRHYFFKRLKNYDEFKKDCSSMLTLQWHYLNEGFKLVIETCIALARASYSLVTLDFSVAGEQLCKATKDALAAIAKIALDLSLLCLHTVRLFTLLIATFYPYAALLSLALISFLSFPLVGLAGPIVGLMILSGCIGYIGSRIFLHLFRDDSNRTQKNNAALKIELDDYRHVRDEVASERTYILNKIDQILSTRPTQAQFNISE